MAGKGGKGDGTGDDGIPPTSSGGATIDGGAADGSAGEAGAKGAGSKLTARIGELEQSLAQAQRELEASAIERRIDAALASSGVIDVEAGRVLVVHELEISEAETVEDAVSSLKRRKPFLFASGGGKSPALAFGGGATLAPKSAPVTEGDELASMRETAETTGDRGALLRYLRARRTA